MSYRETLARVYGLAPRGIDLGLDRVRLAAEALGDPHLAQPSVQIAGTNGKGTIACLLDNGARVCGLSVGLFTSPHLHRFTERIRVDGSEVDEEILDGILERLLDITPPNGTIPLTFFEVATLAAFAVFKRCGVDLAVLEVGLGGRLDATSIAQPAVTTISSIGLDHTAILGNTIAKIAAEKGAIARNGAPLITGPLRGEALKVIQQIALDRGADLRVCGRDFAGAQDLHLPWPGPHNRENGAVALHAFEHLSRIVDRRLESERFISNARLATWPGRFEVVDLRGRFILDGAHNTEAVGALVNGLAERGEKPQRILFGALEGKPIDEMLSALQPLGAEFWFAPPPLDRAADHAGIADRAGGIFRPNIGEALHALTDREGTTLVTGSLFAVAEARRILLGEKSDPPVGL